MRQEEVRVRACQVALTRRADKAQHLAAAGEEDREAREGGVDAARHGVRARARASRQQAAGEEARVGIDPVAHSLVLIYARLRAHNRRRQHMRHHGARASSVRTRGVGCEAWGVRRGV